MKIVVFGAAGRTGREVVSELVERDHSVVAIDIVKVQDDGLPSVEWIMAGGEVSEQYASALQTCDCVISTIGHVRGSSNMTQTETIKEIIRLTPKTTKIISLTGTGVRQPGDRSSLIDKVLNMAIKYLDPHRISDGIAHAEVLKQSRRPFTVLRVLKLVDSDSQTSDYVLSPGGPARLLSSRSLVARVLCDIAENKSWDRKFPVL